MKNEFFFSQGTRRGGQGEVEEEIFFRKKKIENLCHPRNGDRAGMKIDISYGDKDNN